MQYSKNHPFLASIKERYLLTGPGSQKETWHVVLDLKGSGLQYDVGDCVGILPTNSPEVVERTLDNLGLCDGSIRSFLTHKANVTGLTRRIVRAFAEKQPNEAKRRGLEQLLAQKDLLEEYLSDRELWDLLYDHPEVRFSGEDIQTLLQPLLPRFYSIASAQRVVGDEVHLTVRHVAYTSRDIRRQGVCTDFLCYRAPVGEPVVGLFIQKTGSFRLPENPTVPIIMVGPGTGVAPYRAFLQERCATAASGPNWLFFGEWTSRSEFFYRDFWQELVNEGRLRLDTAFSRDQEHKLYVQHRMLEKGAVLWDWLEQGAHFYVCGDAKRMAKDVECALQTIVEERKGCDATSARQFVRQLRRERRYLADVY